MFMEQTTTAKTRIAEFDWLKLSALLLLILVHSELYYTLPEVIVPVMWVLVGDFLFISGFLAFDSFHKRNAQIRSFFKSKFWPLYFPFAAATVFYFLLQVIDGVSPFNPLRLLSQVSLLNIFDRLNTGLFNWSFLWFVPYLLVFMFIFCILEKYVTNPKWQILAAMLVWFLSLLAWVFDIPFKLGLVFSQYFLIFMIGIWVNKFKKYESLMRFRNLVVLVPLAALFSINLTGFFQVTTAPETLMYLVYTNVRSIVFSLSLILLVLLLLRKIGIPKKGYIELIAEISIFIYLTEPFLNFLLKTYIFGQPSTTFGVSDYLWIDFIIRGAIMFGLMPLVYKKIKAYKIPIVRIRQVLQKNQRLDS
jgi:hypothetical protein